MEEVYTPRGKVSERKVKGKSRLVDTWQDGAKKRKHVLSRDEEAAWKAASEHSVPTPPSPPKPVPRKKNTQVTRILPEGAPTITTYKDVMVVGGEVDERRKTGNVVFEQEDGTRHQIPFKSKHAFGTLVARHKVPWQDVLELGTGPGGRLFDRFASEEVPVTIRVATKGDDEKILPLMSDRFSPITVDDIVPTLLDIIGPEQEMTVYESDGIDGGRIEVEFKGSSIANYSIVVTGGNLIGTGSVKMFAQAKILACSNQLTALVAEKFKPIVRQSLFERKVHSGSKGELQEMVDAVHGVGQFFLDTIGKAKTQQLKGAELDRVLAYYVAEGRISARVMEKFITPALQSPEVTQEPGTVYGAAMALSYLGTHEPDLKPGVRGRLNLVAGELVLVADHWNEFMDIVVEAEDKAAAKA